GAVGLDWERDRINQRLSGFDGASAQTVALAEVVRLVNAAKAIRPLVKWGFYWHPWNAREDNMSTLPAWWLAQETSVAPVWQALGAITPEIYQRFKIVESGSAGSQQITAATDLTRMNNYAALSLRCGERGGSPPKPVFPFVASFYYSNGDNPLNGQAIPLDETYRHIKRFMDTTVNGRKPAGVIWWGQGVSPNVTEAQLKAVYQAVNNLPFDTNMPRP
ncbi:MAG: hypothetical protein ACRDGM_00115, partial [bacterium]